MTTFVAIYRGKTIAEAKMVDVSVDPELVALVVRHLLYSEAMPAESDSVQEAILQGRKKALTLLETERPARRSN